MKRWTLLAGALLMMSYALLLCDTRHEPARTKTDVPEQNSENQQAPPANMQRDLELEPKAQPPSNSVAPMNEPTAPSAPPPPAPPMPPSSHFEAMRQLFESESRDDAWAGGAEARIPQLLIDVGFPRDAFDRNATCRRTLCRFSLRLTEQEHDQFALMKLAAAVQTEGSLGLAYGDAAAAGDKTRVVIYLPRAGTLRDDLPAR